MNATRETGRGPGLWRILAWGFVAAMLIAPLVAMQFTNEVNWTSYDFVVAGALLIGAGLLIELVLWKARSNTLRIGAALAIVSAVLVIWAQGAVGIF